MTDYEYVRLLAALISWGASAFVVTNIAYCLWLLAVATVVRLTVKPVQYDEDPTTHYCLLIPAHDEELVIGRTLASVVALDYPPDLLSVTVIADNCMDATAKIAGSYPRVNVLERHDNDKRGKGYALNWALKALMDDQSIDTFVIIDADTMIDPFFLRAMDRARTSTSTAPFVAQGRYDVANHSATWRTALMAGALSLVHVVRPLARNYLHCSVGLKGNGMCFDREIFQSVSWSEESLTEDIDFTLDILEQLELRVQFVEDAKVDALMPTTKAASESQRKRWENGRNASVRQRFAPLFFRGLVKGKLSYIDAAFDLIAPPLAQLSASIFLWLILIGLYAILGGNWRLQAALALASVGGLFVYVIGGFVVGGAPRMAYKALIYAPFYTVWKIMLRVKQPSKTDSDWIKTAREPVAGDVVEVRDEAVSEQELLEISEVKK